MTSSNAASKSKPTVTPRRARTTSDDVARQLIVLIRDKVYRPGDRLRETELATRFGVSRAVIREALLLLSARNLVHSEANRGAIVPRLSDVEAIESVEIAAALFGVAVRRAARECKGALPDGTNEALAQLALLTSGVENAAPFYRQTLRLGSLLIRPFNSMRLLSMVADERLGAPDHYGPVGYSPEEARTVSLTKWRGLVAAISAGDEHTADSLGREIHYDTLAIALAIVG